MIDTRRLPRRENTGNRDGLRPEQSAKPPSARLAPAVFLDSTPGRSSSAWPPDCRPTRQTGAKSVSSVERPVFDQAQLRAHSPLRALSPILAQPRSSAQPGPGIKREPKKPRPRRRQARHECAGAQGIAPESPPLSGKPDANPNRPFFSGVRLVRRVRIAQGRSPAPLAHAIAPIPCRPRAGRSDARSRLPGRALRPPPDENTVGAFRGPGSCIRESLRELRQLCTSPSPMPAARRPSAAATAFSCSAAATPANSAPPCRSSLHGAPDASMRPPLKENRRHDVRDSRQNR